MRGLALPTVCVLLLAACNDEPDFDERFEAAETEIEQTAQSIEQDLNTDSQGEVQLDTTGSRAPTRTDRQ